jgi:hypothetical protein
MLTTNLEPVYGIASLFYYWWKEKNELLHFMQEPYYHRGNLKWHYKTQGRQKKSAGSDDTRPKMWVSGIDSAGPSTVYNREVTSLLTGLPGL